MRSRGAVGSWFVTLTVVVAGALLAGCGVGAQSSPSAISPDDTPSDLVARPTPDRPPSRSAAAITVYFTGPAGLVPVSRPVDGSPSAARRLRALVAGPTTRERSIGLSTAIPREGDLTVVGVTATTIKVQLDPSFGEGAVPDQATAIAQVVFTLTDDHQGRGVAFVLDGKPVSVPRPDGSLVAGRVTREDFATLATGVP